MSESQLTSAARIRLLRRLAEAQNEFELARFEAKESRDKTFREAATESDTVLVLGIGNPFIEDVNIDLRQIEDDLEDAARVLAVERYDALASAYLDSVTPQWDAFMEMLDGISEEAASLEPTVLSRSQWSELIPFLKSRWVANVRAREEQHIEPAQKNPDLNRQSDKVSRFLAEHPGQLTHKQIYLAVNELPGFHPPAKENHLKREFARLRVRDPKTSKRIRDGIERVIDGWSERR